VSPPFGVFPNISRRRHLSFIPPTIPLFLDFVLLTLLLRLALLATGRANLYSRSFVFREEIIFRFLWLLFLKIPSPVFSSFSISRPPPPPISFFPILVYNIAPIPPRPQPRHSSLPRPDNIADFSPILIFPLSISPSLSKLPTSSFHRVLPFNGPGLPIVIASPERVLSVCLFSLLVFSESSLFISPFFTTLKGPLTNLTRSPNDQERRGC